MYRTSGERVRDAWLAVGMWSIVVAGAIFSALPIFF